MPLERSRGRVAKTTTPGKKAPSLEAPGTTVVTVNKRRYVTDQFRGYKGR